MKRQEKRVTRWKRMPTKIALGMLFGAYVSAANAALIYDESVGGDLSENVGLNADSIGELSIGSNEVKASVQEVLSLTTGFDNNRDVFRFSIPDGTQLSSFDLIVNDYSIIDIGNVTGTAITFGISDDIDSLNGSAFSTSFLTEWEIQIDDPTYDLFVVDGYTFSNPPLTFPNSSGEYIAQISHHNLASTFVNPYSFSGDVTIVFEVIETPVSASVPEPSSTLLLSFGTGLLLWSRRRTSSPRVLC